MTFDELLEQIKAEGNPQERLTIQVAQLSAEMAMKMIKDYDMISVVRCEDCKWYERDKQKGGFCRKPEASMWSPGLPIDELKPDDYCSRAKRKENSNGN